MHTFEKMMTQHCPRSLFERLTNMFRGELIAAAAHRRKERQACLDNEKYLCTGSGPQTITSSTDV